MIRLLIKQKENHRKGANLKNRKGEKRENDVTRACKRAASHSHELMIDIVCDQMPSSTGEDDRLHNVHNFLLGVFSYLRCQ